MALPNPSKDRWNAANYTQVKISVKHERAAAFKAACASNNCSITSVLSKYMAEYSNEKPKNPTAINPYETRKKRRNALKHIVRQVEQLMAAEEAYKENIPENLRGSKWYDAAEQSLALMQEAIDILNEVY